jgi:PAS domain S-box-containing protein
VAVWLGPSLIITLCSTIILALAILYLYRQYHERFLATWSIGWGLYALRIVIELYQSTHGTGLYLQALHDAINLSGGVFLLWGARELAGQRLEKIWLVIAALSAGWSLAAAAIKLSFLLVTLPSFTLMAVLYLYTGLTFLRRTPHARLANQVIGWAFILWGLHKLNYPFVRNVDWFAPWGFLISSALELIITFAFFISYFQRAMDEQRRSESRFRAVFEQAGVGVNITDNASHRYVRVNQKLSDMLGYSPTELLGMDITQVTYPDDLSQNLALLGQMTRGEARMFSMEKRYLRKDGNLMWALVSVTPLWQPGEEPNTHITVVQDISPLKRAEDELQTRLEQQACVANVSRLALSGVSLGAVLQRTVELVAETLRVEYSKVLRLQPMQDRFHLVAGYGYPFDQLGQASFPATAATQASYCLNHRQPVLVTNLAEDVRFHEDVGLADQSATSGVTVLIAGEAQPYGMLSAHSQQARRFSPRDVSFLQSIANVLSMAARQEDSNQQLQHYVAELETINRISTALHAAEDLKTITDQVLEDVLSFFSASAGALLIYEAPLTEREVAARGWLADFFARPDGAMQAWLDATQALSGMLPVADFSLAPWASPQLRELLPPDWGGAVLPLKAPGAVIGQLVLSIQNPRELTQAERFLLTTVVEITTSALQRDRLFTQTRHSLARLAALHEIDQTISSNRDLQATLEAILRHCQEQLQADAAEIFLWDASSCRFESALRIGYPSAAAPSPGFARGEGAAGLAAKAQSVVYSLAPQFSQEPSTLQIVYRSLGFQRVCNVPLISHGEASGVLQVCQRLPDQRDDDWYAFLEMLGGQAAIAVENLGLFDHLQRSHSELAQAYNETIEGWSRAMDLRDHETEGHTQRVTEMTVRLARELHISEEEIIHIRRGALLHDIGKMGVPDEVLNKPGPLDEKEWQIMRRHPQLAFDMLQAIRYLRPALVIPYYHHERWNGLGYPNGLSGGDIPLPARIFAIIDVWDALRSPRPYRDAWPEDKVRAYLSENAGVQFDPHLVEAFLLLLERPAAQATGSPANAATD